MATKKSVSKKLTNSTKPPISSFARFLSDPLIATALITAVLIALALSIIEFSQAIAP